MARAPGGTYIASECAGPPPAEGVTTGPSTEDTVELIRLTPAAIAKVKEIQQAEGLQDHGLRVRVVGGGCAGFQYDLYFEDEVGDFDERIDVEGIPVYVDAMSLQYLEGTEIDYVETVEGAGFKFNNPKATATCGCGMSFS